MTEGPAPRPDPHRAADAEARAAARALLGSARDAVLAVLDAEGWPMTSRIALQTDAAGTPLALLSGLALHSAALSRDPRAALLLTDDAATKGSALTRPRRGRPVSGWNRRPYSGVSIRTRRLTVPFTGAEKSSAT
ncbi:hypothetical protein [Paracoccus sanguinis]|uniref:hypothetical protein n=1 Tax=Paracoccus sanguinis TaxID=1545044 RepID=UPI00068DB17C|nr:hypothetical protein [Paracoccus sanguinis]